MRRMAVITVNATQNFPSQVDASPDVPDLTTMFGTLTDLPLARRSREMQLQTSDLVRRIESQSVFDRQKGAEPIDGYVIDVSLKDLGDSATRAALASLPTTWKLTHEQVDLLRRSGAELLRQSPDFQRLLRDVGAR